MKKKLSLLLICLLSTIAVYTQNEKVYVYGVDFSQVKVYGADEPTEQFVEAFKGINILLITEPQKYDFTKMLDTRLGVDVEMMINKLSDCNYSNMRVFGPVYEDINCVSVVKEYNLQQPEGIGIVLIAKFLNKIAAEATYDLVMFDVNTREIMFQKEVVGGARGFGLRNFWAGSIYSILQTETVPIKGTNNSSNSSLYRIDVVEKQQNVEPIQVYNTLKNHGYRGFIDGGSTIGHDFVIEANTSHGFQMNPYFFVGGGMGLHIYALEGVVNLPIFANVRANFLDKKASPYVDYKLGASIGGAPGLYTALAVGCKIRKFDVSLGYTVQLAEYYYGDYTFDYSTINIGGVSLKVGLEF